MVGKSIRVETAIPGALGFCGIKVFGYRETALA
jgi:hypothetical protein